MGREPMGEAEREKLRDLAEQVGMGIIIDNRDFVSIYLGNMIGKLVFPSYILPFDKALYFLLGAATYKGMHEGKPVESRVVVE